MACILFKTLRVSAAQVNELCETQERRHLYETVSNSSPVAQKGEELNTKNFRGLFLELVIKSTVCNNLGGNSW